MSTPHTNQKYQLIYNGTRNRLNVSNFRLKLFRTKLTQASKWNVSQLTYPTTRLTLRRWKLINNEREKNLNNNDTTDKLFEWFYWTNIGIIVLSFEKENSALKVQWNLIKRNFRKVNTCHKLGALKKWNLRKKILLNFREQEIYIIFRAKKIKFSSIFNLNLKMAKYYEEKCAKIDHLKRIFRLKFRSHCTQLMRFSSKRPHLQTII